MAVWGQIIYEIGGRFGEKVNFRLNLQCLTKRQVDRMALQCYKARVIEVW